MRKLVLFVLPLFAAFMLLGGCGQKAPVAGESSISKVMSMACTCSKDCKVCAKDPKNCGKAGCTCMKADMKGMKHEDMKNMKQGEVKDTKQKDTKVPAPAKLFVRQPTKAELGKEVTCPVMTTEKFKVSVATPVIDYKGKAYFMCCKGCPEKFMANPEKYVK